MIVNGLLTIDTAAIAANWRYLSGRMQASSSGSTCAAVVKANAYGLGVQPVAQSLFASGCQTFFVATLVEAIELRDILGFQPDILVLGGLAHGDGSEWFDYRLIPVLIDLAQVERWASICQRLNHPQVCAVKADTGMHRYGIAPEELELSLASGSYWQWCDVRFFLSHLACADDPEHPLNHSQLNSFQQLAAKIKQRYPSVILSLANSAGLFLDENACYDMGRPGAALYGINPTPAATNPMQPVVSLELPVMQHRTIAAGETVGYGATFRASRQTRLAIVFGGYADGLLRLLSNRGCAFYGEQRVPLVGRVSMDSMVFDITDLPESPANLAVLNKWQGVDKLAAAADTIGYEILTSLGSRYHRVYC